MHGVISKATIQQQAKDAYAAGEKSDSNPYPAGSVAHDHWFAAYEKRKFAVESGLGLTPASQQQAFASASHPT